jgi:hypothetical protein
MLVRPKSKSIVSNWAMSRVAIGGCQSDWLWRVVERGCASGSRSSREASALAELFNRGGPPRCGCGMLTIARMWCSGALRSVVWPEKYHGFSDPFELVLVVRVGEDVSFVFFPQHGSLQELVSAAFVIVYAEAGGLHLALGASGASDVAGEDLVGCSFDAVAGLHDTADVEHVLFVESGELSNYQFDAVVGGDLLERKVLEFGGGVALDGVQQVEGEFRLGL